MRDRGRSGRAQEAALEAGAEDVTSSEDGHEIWTAQADLHEVARALEPVLVQWDPWGTRVDRIETTPLWRRAEEIALLNRLPGVDPTGDDGEIDA